MTPNELNIAIAEFCGWTHFIDDEWGPLRGLPPGVEFKEGCVFTEVPNYAALVRTIGKWKDETKGGESHATLRPEKPIPQVDNPAPTSNPEGAGECNCADWGMTVHLPSCPASPKYPHISTQPETGGHDCQCNCGAMTLRDSVRYTGPRGRHTRASGEQCEQRETGGRSELL